MNLLKRSASIYIGGFVFGVIVSSLLITAYPAIYYAFLMALQRKIEAQSQLIEDLRLMIIANNTAAALMASYGGAALSKIIDRIDSETARSRALLYALPGGILFVNGAVLGFFAILYTGYISRYLSAIFPHGFFEIPAIILSGAIGLEICEETRRSEEEFQRDLTIVAMGKLRKFALVLLLIFMGGVIEGGGL